MRLAVVRDYRAELWPSMDLWRINSWLIFRLLLLQKMLLRIFDACSAICLLWAAGGSMQIGFSIVISCSLGSFVVWPGMSNSFISSIIVMLIS